MINQSISAHSYCFCSQTPAGDSLGLCCYCAGLMLHAYSHTCEHNRKGYHRWIDSVLTWPVCRHTQHMHTCTSQQYTGDPYRPHVSVCTPTHTHTHTKASRHCTASHTNSAVTRGGRREAALIIIQRQTKFDKRLPPTPTPRHPGSPPSPSVFPSPLSLSLAHFSGLYPQ